MTVIENFLKGHYFFILKQYNFFAPTLGEEFGLGLQLYIIVLSKGFEA